MSDPNPTTLVGQGEAVTHGAAPATAHPKRARSPARLRRWLRRLPRAAWACMAVAGLNAACWSIVTPPFQTPDEPDHYAYTQDLVETGELPSSPQEVFSTSEGVALRDLQQGQVRYNPQNHTIFTAAAQHSLEIDLDRPLSSVSHNAGVATAEPPLYYALEAIPYYVGSGGTVLDRLALMRLLSSLLAACTAMLVFLFVRETLPRAPWAWTVGGLGVSFAPLLGLMGGSVNPDALLFTVSTALFYLLARGFRRGLHPPLAALIGTTIAIGTVTKLSFIGLLPGALLGVVVLTVRARRVSSGSAYRSLALALVFAASIPSIYILSNLLTGRAAYGTLTSNATSTTGRSLATELSYIWQFYLPRLPGMHSYFPGILTPVKFWIDGFVGLYGWVDTVFPAWVYRVALIPTGLIAVLVLSGLYQGRLALRNRLSELCVYGAMAIGLAGLVGASDYLEYPLSTGSYAQPRYMLPLLALYGAVLALAARGAGRRWGPVVGAALVIGLIAHDLFSGLLEISRFYA